MFFKLSTIAALMLLLLIGTSLADNSCYDSGEKWSDIGTDDEISTAMDILCSRNVGRVNVGNDINKCVNIMGNRINVRFHIISAVNNKNTVYFSQESCKDAFNQVKSSCSKYGGELTGIVVQAKDDGGEWMDTRTQADPNHLISKDCY